MSAMCMTRRIGGRAARDVEAQMLIERTTGVDGESTEVEVSVAGKLHPGTPDVWYLRNGDPGYPGDPAEVEDVVATDEDGQEIELTESEMEKAVELLMEKGGDEE